MADLAEWEHMRLPIGYSARLRHRTGDSPAGEARTAQATPHRAQFHSD